MEVKHAIIEGNPLINRVELHDKGDHFLVVTGNYPGVVFYKSPKFETLEEAETDYTRCINTKWRALPASQFERGNKLIYTMDYSAFYLWDGLKIKNMSYLNDIHAFYASRIASC
jgi:hypothetical protein